ncbi:MAG: NUDIX hydrolase [Candidatus Nanopelagicales bacterium]
MSPDQEQVSARRAAGVILVEPRGAVLLQLRDDRTPVSPDQWSIVGGAIDADEDAEQAARRELLEETGLSVEGPLVVVAEGVYPASVGAGTTEWHLYAAATTATDDDVVLGEGRALVFVAHDDVLDLDLGTSARRFLPAFLASPAYAGLVAEAAALHR